MALTNKEQQCLVLYLGWPAKTLYTDSTHYSKIFVDRITNLDTDTEVKVRELLEKIERVREQMEEAQCRLSTTEVDNIKIREDELRRLRDLDRMYVKWLSQYLDLPVLRCDQSVCTTVRV
jgi:hypothetical protein